MPGGGGGGGGGGRNLEQEIYHHVHMVRLVESSYRKILNIGTYMSEQTV